MLFNPLLLVSSSQPPHSLDVLEALGVKVACVQLGHHHSHLCIAERAQRAPPSSAAVNVPTLERPGWPLRLLRLLRDAYCQSKQGHRGSELQPAGPLNNPETPPARPPAPPAPLPGCAPCAARASRATEAANCTPLVPPIPHSHTHLLHPQAARQLRVLPRLPAPLAAQRRHFKPGLKPACGARAREGTRARVFSCTSALDPCKLVACTEAAGASALHERATANNGSASALERTDTPLALE